MYFNGDFMKKLALLSFLLLNASFVNADEWYSMARHGECVPLSVLAENIKEFRGATSPEKLIENYIESGIKAEIRDLREVVLSEFENMTEEEKESLLPKGAAYQILVNGNPKWILLEKQHCREFL
jgi:hypothetical protein